MPHFSDQVVWITGATSGIGRACALEFAQRGAKLALSGRREERLERLAARLRASGVPALAVACDVRHDAQVAEATQRIVSHWGGLHVAMANAGYTVAGSVEELTGDLWRQQFDTNVVGAALVARHALPHLRETNGRLSLTGSVAGYFPAPGFAAYHASKYALRALGQTLSIELSGSGVSCTTVHPGFVHSEITQVDSDGCFDARRQETRPRALLWPTERAARIIVSAIQRRRRELVFTAHGKLAAWVGMHLPGVAHHVMSLGPMLSQAKQFRVRRT